ncbi:MAG TPA: SufD family Fe-S cluster assembly protein [Acidimicrobiales bacterium]|nr:SufD family Fe-S cluster assembly protein [Acidimicrobiales bacterium]
MILPTFSAEASASLGGPGWLRQRRAAGFEAFSSTPLPSESEEVWRYSPIDELSLGDFAPDVNGSAGGSPGATTAGKELLESVRAALGNVAASVLVHAGRPVAGTWTGTGANGNGGGATFSFGPADEVDASADLLGSVQHGGDALVRLNDAFMPDAVFVDVPAGLSVDGPILVVHWCDPGAAAFPRLCVRAGAGAAVSLVEVFAGPEGSDRSLVVPVTELSADAHASVSYLSLQVLPETAWSIARLSACGAGDSLLRTFTVGLGAAYDRVRTDVTVDGRDARSEILSTYLGDGTQVHDIRTLQDHAAPKTDSELLCQGAVAGRSRSVYSGLIRVHRGAVRSDARQTNNNLVLNEGAHADSVPNLDILENDVKCSHASTVGPVDEDQMYYIESRGVAPEVAEGLIVRGFFDAIIDRGSVPEATPLLQREVHARLDAALGGRRVTAGV